MILYNIFFYFFKRIFCTMRSRKIITTRVAKMDCSILKLGDKWRILCKWKRSSKIDECLEMILNVTERFYLWYASAFDYLLSHSHSDDLAFFRRSLACDGRRRGDPNGAIRRHNVWSDSFENFYRGFYLLLFIFDFFYVCFIYFVWLIVLLTDFTCMVLKLCFKIE